MPYNNNRAWTEFWLWHLSWRTLQRLNRKFRESSNELNGISRRRAVRVANEWSRRKKEGGGRTRAMPIKSTSIEEIQSAIHANVEIGSHLFTDEHAAYNDLDGLFFRTDRVNHSANQYVNGMASTNGIESVWAVLKRGLNGVYHQVSKKHLARYVDEFAFRLNAGKVSRHTLERLDSFVAAIAGKRITYKELTA